MSEDPAAYQRWMERRLGDLSEYEGEKHLALEAAQERMRLVDQIAELWSGIFGPLAAESVEHQWAVQDDGPEPWIEYADDYDGAVRTQRKHGGYIVRRAVGPWQPLDGVASTKEADAAAAKVRAREAARRRSREWMGLPVPPLETWEHATETVMPPPGVSMKDWLDQWGEHAGYAGVIAAALKAREDEDRG